MAKFMYGLGFAAVATVLMGAAPALGDAPGDDMLTPDEVQTTGVSSAPENDSGFFIGAGLGFGQARPTEGDASPGTAYLFKVEPGYQIGRGSWNRVEASVELLSGSLAFRTSSSNLGKVTLPVGLGALAKLGYGYSLGGKMFGLAKVGVGPVMGKFKAEGAGADYESASLSGLAAQLGWTMIVPMGDSFDAALGIAWTHMQFDVGQIKRGSTTFQVDRNVIANVPQIELGVRVRL